MDWIRRGSAAVRLRNLTAQTLPTRVWMAPSLSPASTAFSVKKKYTLSLSLSALSGMRWAATNFGSGREEGRDEWPVCENSFIIIYVLYICIYYIHLLFIAGPTTETRQTFAITFLTIIIIIEGTKTVKCGQVYPVGQLPWSSFWSVSVLMVERLPMLLKITESLPRKSAVSPVYSSPPNEKRGIRRGVGESTYDHMFSAGLLM